MPSDQTKPNQTNTYMYMVGEKVKTFGLSWIVRGINGRGQISEVEWQKNKQTKESEILIITTLINSPKFTCIKSRQLSVNYYDFISWSTLNCVSQLLSAIN